jgi:hypothetical protein
MTTISYKSFNLDNLKLSTPEENKQKPDITKYQLMSMPRYLKDGQEVMPQIQGPWMSLDTYGIPGKAGKGGQPILNSSGQPLSDRERGRLKVPLSLNNSETKKFHELLTAIDKKCEDDKEKIWGDKKKANVYKYQHMVRQPPEDPDAPEDAPVRPDYITLKFDLDYATAGIKTKVYLNNDGDRSEVATPTLDDVQKHVRYKCEFRPVFSLCKLFGSKAADTDGKRKFGLGLKLKHIEVKPSQVSAQEEQENAFVDDEDDDDNVQRRVLVKETKPVAPAPFADDDEEAPPAKPAAKVEAAPAAKVTKASAKVEVPPESEEDEEDKPEPAPKPRRGRAGAARTTV